MGKYAGLVDVANGYTGNLSTIDFTEWDAGLAAFPNQSPYAEAQEAEVIRDTGKDSDPTLTPDGVILDGAQDQIFFKMSTASKILRSAVIVFKVSSNSTGTLFESGLGTSGTFDFRGYMYGSGNFEGDVGSGPNTTAISEAGKVQVDKICHLMLVNNGVNSKMYFGVDGVTESLPIADYDTVSGPNIYTSIGSTRNRFTFAAMEVLFYSAWSSEITEAELLGLIQQFGKYGQMTLPTNLESTRIQSAIALGPNREVNSSAGIPIGTSDLTINIAVSPGELIEFFAFDSDGNRTNLTTGGVIPNEAETLVFNPVAGAGGEPTTGVIAHISGTVSIDGTGSEREVIVISDDPEGRQVLGEGMSASDGTFDIQYQDWGGAVIALALDDYGGNWAPSTALASGTIIHPTVPNGYVYEATSGGTTGTEEPTWSINSAVSDGSVTYNPKPFYRPIASGPLQGEVLP